MSILDTIGGFFSGAVNGVIDLAKKAWNALHTVWNFLVRVGGILTGAWDWMVNGVTWLTSQVSNWAAAVYSNIWHILTNVIPGAAEWAVRKALSIAGAALAKVANWAKGAVANAVKWVKGELGKLAATAKSWVNAVIRYVTSPIRWIYNVAKHAVDLVLHPEALAKYLVKHLVVPLILFMLRSGGPVIAWFIKSFMAQGSELAHLLEDVIARVV